MQNKLKIWRKFLILFIFPILIVFYLYPPTEKIIFNGKEYQKADFKISDKNFFQKKPTFKNLMADIFSVPLFLDWYKVSIINRSSQESLGCLKYEPLIIRFNFIEGDPRIYGTNLKEGVIEGGYNSKYPEYYLRSGESFFFIAPSSGKYVIDGGLLIGGCQIGSGFDTDFLDLTPDYKISIKPYWPAWFMRLFVIFIFWGFSFSTAVSLVDWLKR